MDAHEAARVIEANADYRLLRRVPPAEQWGLAPAQGETRRAVLVDTETTGLDQESDEVIELALLPFEYERDSGRIVAVDERQALSGLREPSIPIPPEATKLHGITDDMVKGRRIDPDRVKAIIKPAHLIIAHNAAFDRPMVESTGRCLKTSTGPARSPTSTGGPKASARLNSITSSTPKAGFTMATAP